jgi:hypothetical protein
MGGFELNERGKKDYDFPGKGKGKKKNMQTLKR